MAQSFDPAAYGRVDPHRSCLEDEAADEGGIDLARCFDLAAGRLFDLLEQLARVCLRKLVGSGQLDVEAAFLCSHQPVELPGDLLDLGAAALLRGQAEEVAHELVWVDGALGEE